MRELGNLNADEEIPEDEEVCESANLSKRLNNS